MIVPMKKAHIVVLKEDKEKLLKNLQKASILMLINSEDKEVTADYSLENELLQKTEASIKILSKYRNRNGLVKEEVVVSYEKFKEDNPRRLELLDLINRTNEKLLELHTQRDALHQEIKSLSPWLDLNVKLDELSSTKFAKIYLGFIPNSKVEEILDVLYLYGCDSELLGTEGSQQALIFSCFVDEEKELLAKLTTLGFTSVNLPKVPKTPKEIIIEDQEKIIEIVKVISNYTQELKSYTNEYEELLILADKIASEKELKKAPVSETYAAAYVVGWVRSDQLDILEKVVANTTSDYDLAITDPKEGDVVPTALKNDKFVSSFEPITDMFSVPNINDVDPNPIMSFWYWLIFGMMMGDAGYGLVLLIGSILILKLKKPKGTMYKMIKMFQYGAYSTILFGVLFSSYFGYSLHKPILLNPQVDILKFLIVSIVVGTLHVVSGFLVRAYANFKEGKVLDAIFDNFAWVFLLIGIGLYFVPHDVIKKVGLALAITGVVLIVFTHGRKNKNIFAKIGGGLYSLYNSVSIFSDILSYSRILALSLSSAIVAMVMNTLAELFPKNVFGIIASALVYIIGHAFNLVMGLLSAYVHDSRLQYIEFFGKFYEGGGVAFKPLSFELKHIDKIEKIEI